MKRLLSFALPLIIIAVSGAGAYWLIMTAPRATPKAPEEKIWPLAVTKGEVVTITPRIEVFGEITAGSSVTLRPLVSGRVVKVGKNLMEGAVIEKGELLAQIDKFDYRAIQNERIAELAEAQGMLKETKADLSGERDQIKHTKHQIIIRKRDYQRRVNLRKKGSGTEKSVDDAELLLNEAELLLVQRRQKAARLEARSLQQQAQVARARVAVSRAERNLANTTLIAPFKGFLLDTEAAVGRIMSTSDPVARIINAKLLEAKFELTESDYGRLFNTKGGLLGRSARVHWSIGKEKLSFDAKIIRKGAEIDAATGGVKFYARLSPDERIVALRPGAFVRIEVADKSYENVIRLPATAIENRKFIYIVKNKRLVRVAVLLLRRLGRDVLVRSGDNEYKLDGATIVTQRFPEIGPGLQVEIR